MGIKSIVANLSTFIDIIMIHLLIYSMTRLQISKEETLTIRTRVFNMILYKLAICNID